MNLSRIVCICTMLALSASKPAGAQEPPKNSQAVKEMLAALEPESGLIRLTQLESARTRWKSYVDSVYRVSLKSENELFLTKYALKLTMLFADPKNADTAILRKDAAKKQIQLQALGPSELALILPSDIRRYLMNPEEREWVERLPVLKKLVHENLLKVIYVTPDSAAMVADSTAAFGIQIPEIEIPAMVLQGLSNNASKKDLAALCLEYINGLFGRYPELPQTLLAEYKRSEKDKVPAGDYDRLLDRRVRFILYLKENIRSIIS